MSQQRVVTNNQVHWMIIQIIPTKHIKWQNQDNHLNKESKTKTKEFGNHSLSREDTELGMKTLNLTLQLTNWVTSLISVYLSIKWKGWMRTLLRPLKYSDNLWPIIIERSVFITQILLVRWCYLITRNTDRILWG